MQIEKKIEIIYQKIFKKVKDSQLDIFAYSLEFGYANEETKIAFLFELTEQINFSRKGMIHTFGKEIVKELEELKTEYFH